MKFKDKRIFARTIYKFDATLNRHIGGAMLILLAALGLIIIFAGTLMALPGWGPDDSDIPTAEGWWMGLTRSLDPGTFGADNGFKFRLLGLLVTLAGLLSLAILIGLISNAVDRRITYLRSGRTEVMEQGHFLLLGWSNKAVTIVDELLKSSNNSKVRIVVLARMDRDEIEDALEQVINKKHVKQVVVRTGDYTQISELERVKPIESKSIILINDDSTDGDADIVRTVMSLLRIDPDLRNTSIVTEIKDPNIGRALSDLCGEKLLVVNSLRLVARITAQTLRNPGLSSVYEDLLNFDGDEFYLVKPDLSKFSTFGQASVSTLGATVIGIEKSSGEVLISPESETKLNSDDQLIVLGQDLDSIEFSNFASNHHNELSYQLIHSREDNAEHFEILGWSDLGPLILSELDAYIPKGSTVAIRFDSTLANVSIDKNFENFEVSVIQEVDTTDYLALQRILEKRNVDHVMVLCYRDSLDIKSADARTLLTLAQVRHIIDQNEIQDITLISELLDVSDVEIVQVATPDDYVVSERLSSLLIAQLANQPDLFKIFSEIFSVGGHDVVFKNVLKYGTFPNSQISVSEATELARSQGQVLLGWKYLDESDQQPSLKIRLNVNNLPVNQKYSVDSLVLLRRH